MDMKPQDTKQACAKMMEGSEEREFSVGDAAAWSVSLLPAHFNQQMPSPRSSEAFAVAERVLGLVLDASSESPVFSSCTGVNKTRNAFYKLFHLASQVFLFLKKQFPSDLLEQSVVNV